MRRWRSEGRVLFWKVRVAALRCRNSPPAKSSRPALFFFFLFFPGGAPRPLLFFLSWTHLPLPLTLRVIYVPAAAGCEEAFSRSFSRFCVFAACVWRRRRRRQRQRPAPPAAEQMFGCSSTFPKLKRIPVTTAAGESFPAADRL